jgi:NADH-quinone oxidoreductase subunit M
MELHTSDIAWLSLLILTLPIGAAVTLLAPQKKARWVALTTALVGLLISLIITVGFDKELQGFQYVEQSVWIQSLNIQYFLGIDGISVLFLPATSLLFIFVILASWNTIQELPKVYFSLLLLLEASVLGIFCALDTIFFILFWEMTLIPLYFLISLWGIGANRRYAGVKYVLLMMSGGLPMLFAFILLAMQADGSYIFSYPELLETAPDNPYQTVIFFLLLVGFGIKTPLFPMHTWLPLVAQEGHPATIATLVGLKLGAYGLLRFTVPLAPDVVVEYQGLLIGLGIIGVIYGGIAALSQTNLRRMLAYSSLSHVGMVVLGIATLSLAGIQGAVFQLLSFTLVAGGLFLLTGFIHQRIGSTDTISLGGMAKSMPLLSAFFFFLGLASMGIPATSAFPGELLIILSSLNQYTGIGLAALFGVILSAAYFLRIYRAAFLGTCRHEIVADAVDLQTRELIIVVIISALVLAFGLYPQLILDYMANATQTWTALLKPL